MGEEKKMKKLIASISMGVILLLVAGVTILWRSTGDFIISFQTAKNFEELMTEYPKEGTKVVGNVVYAYDCFASEETWKENKNGSRTAAKTSSYYYSIPSGDYILALKVKADQASSMSQLSEETFNVYTGAASATTTKVPFEGKVSKMDQEMAEIFTEYLQEIGFTEAEIAAMGPFLLLENCSFVTMRILFVVGIVLVLLGILLFLRAFKKNSASDTISSNNIQL